MRMKRNDFDRLRMRQESSLNEKSGKTQRRMRLPVAKAIYRNDGSKFY